MILLIDDEERWIAGYREALEWNGFECNLVSNVDVLNTLIDEGNALANVDLIILDIMMAPRKRYKDVDTADGMKTGMFILEDIRKRHKTVPVIILTNKDRDTEFTDSDGPYYSAYLLKEATSPQDLVNVVESIIGRSA